MNEEKPNEVGNISLTENLSNSNKIKKTNKVVRNTIVLLIVCFVLTAVVFAIKEKNNLANNAVNNTNTTISTNMTNTVNITPVNLKSSYRLDGNGLSDFDLVFMQMENNGENKIYSPLSIKYALEMLAEGANGETKTQLDNVIGDYVANKYPNSKNMSFANAFFIKNDYKDYVLSSYTNTLKSKYSAEVKYDSFDKPDTLNKWVNEKTLGLIDKLYEKIKDSDYILVNALAIDMKWNKSIQSTDEDYVFDLKHEYVTLDNYKQSLFSIDALDSYDRMRFEGTEYYSAVTNIAAVANKYDIISELGEDKIRTLFQTEHNEWLQKATDKEKQNDHFNIDTYIAEIKTNYKKISSSTDFLFYDNEDVKVFAKDLKTYDDKTLQYVGIMPKKGSLNDYIQNADASKINSILSKLKTIDLNNFEDGVLTYVHGQIPVFKFDYQLKFVDDLKSLGISDAFNPSKADFSKMTNTNSYVSDAVHKATIDFSNDGIKASAVTAFKTYSGEGFNNYIFNYSLDIPVKEIDLTFDRPFIYFIRDKDTKEVWFVGSVYKPANFDSFRENY